MTRLDTFSRTVRPLAAALVALAGCGAPADGGTPEPPGSSEPTAGSSGTGGAAPLNPLGRERCRAPAGVSSSPADTQEAIALLNALPKPTSVACFVESLARPLAVQITSSGFSAQPALSAASPRVFIKVGKLWLSIVIDGDSSYLVEFGELVADQPRSIKGELQLPLQEPVAPSLLYDRVRFGSGSACRLCHYDETHADELPFENAFSSISFRPRDDSYVSVDSLREQAQSCDVKREPHRCELLSAVFDGGEVREEPFPSSMITFF